LLNIENISAVLWGTVTGVTTFLLIIILSVLVLVHEKRIQVTLGRMYPEQWDELISIARNAVGNYALGLLVVMLVVFVLYLIGLYVIGIPYALLLAWLAAVATLVPTVGTLLGALFATIAAGILTGSLINALLVIAWFGSVQQIEEYFILPQVVGGRVSLNPMTTIMSVVGRGVLRWVWWLFLAIPIMGIVKQIGSIQGKHFALLMWTEDIDE
jgi:predicted PurR-regulated permease PerM